MKKSIVVILGFLGAVILSPQTSAAAGLTIQPIIGYERTQKLLPMAHTTDRLIYGVRATYGTSLLAAEAEYTRGTDSESFSALNTSTTDTADKLKVGATSTFRLTTMLSLQGRAGMQGKITSHQETVGGVVGSAITSSPVYNPYAGATLTSYLGNTFSLSGGVTVVFGNFPDMSKNDYETTLGFNIHVN